MKQPALDKKLDELVELKMKAIDIVVDELIEPLGKLGNPEELIGKKFEEWTAQDRSMLAAIYGAGDNTPLANTIFRHKYAEVKALEAEEESPNA